MLTSYRPVTVGARTAVSSDKKETMISQALESLRRNPAHGLKTFKFYYARPAKMMVEKREIDGWVEIRGEKVPFEFMMLSYYPKGKELARLTAPHVVQRVILHTSDTTDDVIRKIALTVLREVNSDRFADWRPAIRVSRERNIGHSMPIVANRQWHMSAAVRA